MGNPALPKEILPSLRLDFFLGEDPSDGRRMLLIRAGLLPSPPELLALAGDADGHLLLSRAEDALEDLGLQKRHRCLSPHGGDPAFALLAAMPGGVGPGQYGRSADATVCSHWADSAEAALSEALSPNAPSRAFSRAEFFFEGVPAARLADVARAASFPIQVLPAGSFECSGSLIAIDPCYGSPGDGADLGSASGTYRAWSVLRGAGDWGARRAELWICAEGVSPLAQFPGAEGWALEASDVGVDSGQCGFFSGSSYWSAKSDPALDDPFYRCCCEATSSLSAGAVGFGVVSSSGDGDGGYECRTLRGPDGALLAARLEFYPRDPEFEADLLSAKAAFESPLIGSAAAESPPRRLARRL